MALTKTDKDDIRAIFRDSFSELFPGAFHDAFHDAFPKAFYQASTGMHEDVKAIRQVQSQHSIEHADQKAGIYDLKASVRGQSVMLEDLESRFTALCEAVDENLNVRSQIRDHETRLITIESVQNLIRQTLKEHSRQLKLYNY